MTFVQQAQFIINVRFSYLDSANHFDSIHHCGKIAIICFFSDVRCQRVSFQIAIWGCHSIIRYLLSVRARKHCRESTLDKTAKGIEVVG